MSNPWDVPPTPTAGGIDEQLRTRGFVDIREYGDAQERARTMASAFKTQLTGTLGDLVMEELAAFCHVHRSTAEEGDAHSMAILEGRRQVYLRIQQFINAEMPDTPSGGYAVGANDA